MEMWTKQFAFHWKCKTFHCAWAEDISIFNATVASLERKGQTSWQIFCQLWDFFCPQHTFHWDTSRHSAVQLIESRWPLTWILFIPHVLECVCPAWLKMDGMRRGVRSRSLCVPLWWQWSIFWVLAHSDLGGEVGIKALFICCGQSQRDKYIRSQGNGWRDREKES